MRNALVYVLNNFRKHIRGTRGLDSRSSAPWFDGWRRGLEPMIDRPPVAAARTWLARIGWRRHGMIDIEESPRAG